MSMENPMAESTEEKETKFEKENRVKIVSGQNEGMEGTIFLVNVDGTIDVVLKDGQRVKENESNLEKIEEEPVEEDE
ncbi:MAG: hypothetical protein U9N04_02025 [Patescibacteria group bacterium]|nr:hypothetical protein [Patescibacteria group bacterium]